MSLKSDDFSRIRIAVCLGGTSTRVAALDQNYRFIDEQSVATDCGGDLMEESKTAADRPAFTLEHWNEFVPHRKTLLDDLCDAVNQTAGKMQKLGCRVQGVGLSAPGAIHPISGEVLGSTGAMNLPAWGEFN
ncbi:MAG: hypothetical protein KJ645_08930, partial [Planctomycetes bacterium]|nr:hypothetical protein [Planctomycetota bacterium]